MNDWPKIDHDGIRFFEKTPESVAKFGIDWAPWLVEPGNSTVISTSTWTVPAGITKDDEDNDTTRTTVLLSGGQSGINYDLVNVITTVSGGLVEPRVIRIKCVEKISR